MTAEDEHQDECFIVGVIGKAGSPERVHADWFIDGIVSPVFKAHYPQFDVVRADRMNTPGIITSQIIEKLLTAKLVIADMTFLNANAFYEIGIRHMTGLPIIHAHQDGDPIPFDVSSFLSLGYSRVEYQHVVAAQASLRLMVDNVLADGFQQENPVTQARGRAQFDETASDNDQLLQQQIDSLSDRIIMLERGATPAVSDRSQKIIVEALLAQERKRLRKFAGGEPVPQVLIETSREADERVLASFVKESIEGHEMLGLQISYAPNGNSVTLDFSSEFPLDLQVKWEKQAALLGLEWIPFR